MPATRLTVVVVGLLMLFIFLLVVPGVARTALIASLSAIGVIIASLLVSLLYSSNLKLNYTQRAKAIWDTLVNEIPIHPGFSKEEVQWIQFHLNLIFILIIAAALTLIPLELVDRNSSRLVNSPTNVKIQVDSTPPIQATQSEVADPLLSRGTETLTVPLPLLMVAPTPTLELNIGTELTPTVAAIPTSQPTMPFAPTPTRRSLLMSTTLVADEEDMQRQETSSNSPSRLPAWDQLVPRVWLVAKNSGSSTDGMLGDLFLVSFGKDVNLRGWTLVTDNGTRCSFSNLVLKSGGLLQVSLREGEDLLARYTCTHATGVDAQPSKLELYDQYGNIVDRCRIQTNIAGNAASEVDQ